MSVSLHDYLGLVGNKIALAEERADRAEVVRLLTLLRDTVSDKILELEPPAPEPVETITHDLDVSGTADTTEPKS